MALSKREQLIELYARMATEGYQTTDNRQIPIAYSEMEIIMFKEFIKPLFDRFEIKTILDYGCGGSDYHKPGFADEKSAIEYFGLENVFLYEPARNIDDRKAADAVVCFDVLEHLFISDIPETIRELFRHCKKLLVVNVACYSAKAMLPNGENAHITVRPPLWWKGMFDSIAVEYPQISIQLLCSTAYLNAKVYNLYQADDWINSESFTTSL